MPNKKYTSITITKSDRDKKFKAVLRGLKVKKTIHFGAKGMSDFTIHKDKERKKRYLARHKVNENWNVPDTAGSLSRWILWNKPSFTASFNDYKNKFNLR